MARALALLLVILSSASPVHAEEQPGAILQDAWSAQGLDAAISNELDSLDARKASVVAAYNNLGARLGDYDGWCSSYGITALRNVIEGKLFFKLFEMGLYPAYHVYQNDPFFAPYRNQVDNALSQAHSSGIDVGKCVLTEALDRQLKKDPKNFDPAMDEFKASFPYVVLAGNFRLIEQERAILLELRGMLRGSGERNSDKNATRFVELNFQKLHEKIQDLRARTLQGYEVTFRAPLGGLETYQGKQFGFRAGESAPNLFYIFERRAYYVNEERVAAGDFFEASVKNFSAAEAVENRFLDLLREGQGK
jgi:hypothetical protein